MKKYNKQGVHYVGTRNHILLKCTVNNI